LVAYIPVLVVSGFVIRGFDGIAGKWGKSLLTLVSRRWDGLSDPLTFWYKGLVLGL